MASYDSSTEIDRTARMVGRAAESIPTLNAKAKDHLHKAQRFLGEAAIERATEAEDNDHAIDIAEALEAARTWAEAAIVSSGHYEGYPDYWPQVIMAEDREAAKAQFAHLDDPAAIAAAIIEAEDA